MVELQERRGRTEILKEIFEMVGIKKPPSGSYLTRRNLIYLHTWIKTHAKVKK